MSEQLPDDNGIECVETIIPDLAIIRLSPVHDTYNARNTLNDSRALLKDGYSKIIYDLGKVEYFSSVSFGTFVEINTMLRSKPDAGMILCNIPKSIIPLFKEMGFQNAFYVTSTVDSAIEVFRSGSMLWRMERAIDIGRIGLSFNNQGHMPMYYLASYLASGSQSFPDSFSFSSERLSLIVHKEQRQVFRVVSNDINGIGDISASDQDRDSYSIHSDLHKEIERDDLTRKDILEFLQDKVL